MTQNSPFAYDVASREHVTIHVQPIGVAPLVTAALNGASLLPNPSKPPLTYEFDAKPNQHDQDVVKFVCSFAGDEEDSARYDFTVSGSKGGHFTNIPPVRKTDPLKERIFTFTVA